jgi:hypothetical protein
VVQDAAVAHVLKHITRGSVLRAELDAAFRRLELRQPALAELLADELADMERAEDQALGYFLLLVVYLTFDHAFGERLQTVSHHDLGEALEELLTDSEVRESCARDSYSEDALAAAQPALMRMIKHELARAEPDDESITREARTALSQALLLELMVLSEAVAEDPAPMRAR